MPFWYYDKEELKDTPSFRDGINCETENRYRTEGARFIIDTGAKMDLGYNTIATGVVYFHRFYMFHSFKTYPRYVTACSCLFLAGKVEETPKKCKDIIKTAKGLLTEEKFASFAEDPKEEVMTLERVLLQTIKFDLQVDHPYKYLLRYAKCLKGDKAKLQNMIQMAWTFVNDSLCTTLCLQWEPEIIAVALIYLAGRLSRFEVVDWNGKQPKHLKWWNMFIEDITMEILEDICLQALDLYPQTNSFKVLESHSSDATNGTIREKPATPPIVSTVNTSNVPVTITRISATETNSVPVNERPVDDVIENARLIESSVQFQPYTMNFSNNLIYPPVYPPLDLSIPPPNVVPMKPIAPNSNAIRYYHTPPADMPPSLQHQFQSHFNYSPNLSYIPRIPGPPPFTNQTYYPPKL